ncbi:MAG: hypothetical protein ABI721_05395 [Candidatus Dojkabacteria bacterium]
MTRNETWDVFGNRVVYCLRGYINLLKKNPNIPSIGYLIDRLIGISSLWQQFLNLNNFNSFTIELVAKSIKMYLRGEKEELGEILAGSYTYLLTSRKPEVHSRHIEMPKSIWEDLIDCIIAELNKSEDDGKLILRLIQAKNIGEVAAIVGYEI